MPYIEAQLRPLAEKTGAETPGELNYLFTREIVRYLQLNGVSYRVINDVLGALEGAKQEFYRRVAAPYEDKKIILNQPDPYEEILCNL